MTAAYVIDSKRAELGLRVCIGADIACIRHRTRDRRAVGIWEVVAGIPEAIGRVLGGQMVYSRPAVIDDFGSLVFVGEPQ